MGSVIAGVFICWALVNDPGGEDAKKSEDSGGDLSIFIGVLLLPLILAAIAIVIALIPVALAIALVVLALIAVWWLLSRFVRFLHRKASERAQRDDSLVESETADRKRGMSWSTHMRERVRTASATIRRMTKREKSEHASHVGRHAEASEKSFRVPSVLVLRGRSTKRATQKEEHLASHHRDESSRRVSRTSRLFQNKIVSDAGVRSNGVASASGTKRTSPAQRLLRVWQAVKHAVHPRNEKQPPRERRSQVHAALNLAADLEGNPAVARTMAKTGHIDVSTQLRRIGWFTRMRMHRLRPH